MSDSAGKDPKQPPGQTGQAYLLASASSIGLSLVIALALGGLGGWYLDKYLGSAPWGFIGGLIAGAAAGFRNLYILAKRLDKQQGKENDGR
ncbi:MAG: AtpZ/AtpI family protein [Deltaproteobacteria bacterium]|jgi:ATP synthase protein I|nr:AtpZ/AtpI family protein [Deltaproteobacteria bacterium]